jgi:DNA-binding transcriptional LysR family regulator
MDNIRLDDFRLVAALAEHPSLTAASAALGLPKQTVSRRLEALERALGARLFERGSRRLRLTDDGRGLAERAREVVRLADEAVRALHDTAMEPSGTLRLTTTHTVAEHMLGDVVRTFLERWPSVRLELYLTERHVDLVEEGFDAAIRAGPLPAAGGLVAARLGPARLRYVASPSYLTSSPPLDHPHDLAHHRCLIHPLGPAPPSWPFVLDGALAALPVPGRLVANSAEVGRQAAVAGLGVALLAEPVCAQDLERGALVTVLEAYTPEIGGLWWLTAGKGQASRVRAFVEIAREVLGAP